MTKLTKLVTRQQQAAIQDHIQIFEFNGDEATHINMDASWDELLTASYKAQDNEMDFTMEINPVEGGVITITTWTPEIAETENT